MDKTTKKELREFWFFLEIPNDHIDAFGKSNSLKYQVRDIGHLQNLAGIHLNPVRAVKEFRSEKFDQWTDLENKVEL